MFDRPGERERRYPAGDSGSLRPASGRVAAAGRGLLAWCLLDERAMRLGLTLAPLLCAIGGVLAPSPARAGDGAGLFALPPARAGAAGPLDAPPPSIPRSASTAPVTRWFERAIDAVATGGPAQPRVVPLVNGGGGGLRVVLPVCEDGCFRYATRAVALASPEAAGSLLERLIALVRRVPSPDGPPGLSAVREEARRSRANVPQQEANALPE